jgi:hypothetical protein
MKILNKLLHFATIVIVLFAFLAANTIKLNYTPYQILVWEIKANEGYKPTWYKDGWLNGKQAYSIGFGWNDLGQVRRHEIAEYTKDGTVDYDEALKITLMEIAKYGKLNGDPYKNIALQLYSYNCGKTTSGKSLGKCCGADKGCGNQNLDIRKSHGRRRKMELALWNHNFKFVEDESEKNQIKVKQILQTL